MEFAAVIHVCSTREFVETGAQALLALLQCMKHLRHTLNKTVKLAMLHGHKQARKKLTFRHSEHRRVPGRFVRSIVYGTNYFRETAAVLSISVCIILMQDILAA